MKIMKCILISFIVISLTFQGFLRSVSAADTLKQHGTSGFALQIKPLTMNEQVFLENIEAKKHSLLNQAAGAYYDEKYEKQTQMQRTSKQNSFSPGHTLIGGAVIGAFFGLLTSSGDTKSVKNSIWKGALYGVATVSILYYVF